MKVFSLLMLCIFSLMSCEDKDAAVEDVDNLVLETVRIGPQNLKSNSSNYNTLNNTPIVIIFTSAINIETVDDAIHLYQGDLEVDLDFSYSSGNKVITATHPPLDYLSEYTLIISNDIRGEDGERFEGKEFFFETRNGQLHISEIKLNNQDITTTQIIKEVLLDFNLMINFSEPLDTSTDLSQYIFITKKGAKRPLNFVLNPDNNKITITPDWDVDGLTKYRLEISKELKSESGFSFTGFSKEFYTAIDSTYKFPEISDEELLTKVQEQTFKYFWDFAHPNSGLARERNTSGNTVTIGGSGFGVMAIIVGIERGFITRQEGVDRLEKIVNFLEDADRFHGVWPHWINGNTGEVIPFSTKDNGGDLVETAFMIQGLLTVREYLNATDPQESAIIDKITQLWEEVEWDWYTQNGQDVLYWHWSPNYGWEMNHRISGWNESLIVYVLAASSPTHSIEPEVYHEGWARNGAIENGNDYYGINLPLGGNYGGPLFFAHYSFLGLDPRKLEDQYANYWDQNVSHSLINRQHAVVNPQNYVGYGSNAWGFTASDNHEGYAAHSPTNDKGVITPTAALSSFPYTPEKSMDALKHFYYLMGDKLWGPYGFYDAYNPTHQWYADSYLAIDQGPIIIMIENYRTGLIWDLFMSAPEVQSGLMKLGFSYE